MKMTIREVMSKLRDIERAAETVEKCMPDEKMPYVDVSPKDEVIDLLLEYAESIKNAKVDI